MNLDFKFPKISHEIESFLTQIKKQKCTLSTHYRMSEDEIHIVLLKDENAPLKMKIPEKVDNIKIITEWVEFPDETWNIKIKDLVPGKIYNYGNLILYLRKSLLFPKLVVRSENFDIKLERKTLNITTFKEIEYGQPIIDYVEDDLICKFRVWPWGIKNINITCKYKSLRY